MFIASLLRRMHLPEYRCWTDCYEARRKIVLVHVLELGKFNTPPVPVLLDEKLNRNLTTR